MLLQEKNIVQVSSSVIIQELNGKMNSSKDARIKYSKILRYIDRLRAYGVAIGEPTHLLPSLPENTVIVMDNASFHRKSNTN